MNKKLIRLTEGDLHRIVKESVNRVLSEGKFINNKKGYFADNPNEYEYSEEPFVPGNEYAKKDAIPSRNVHGGGPNGRDWSEFDGAVDRHFDREHEKDYKDYGGKNPNRDLILAVAKMGIPTKLAWKLSRRTLYDVMRQLSSH